MLHAPLPKPTSLPHNLHVAILTADLSPRAGGLASSVPSLVGALERTQPVRIDVLGTRPPDEDPDFRVWGSHVHALRQYGPRSFHWSPTLPRTLDKVAPDLIDAQGLWMHQSKVCLEHFYRHRTPYLITPRGMLDPWALRYARWKKRIAVVWFQRAHLSNACCLRATATLEARHIRDLGLRQPIAVVPNGVDVPPRAPGAPGAPRPGDRHRLLFLSRLHPKKGLPLLLRAWSRLAPRFPQWELVIAGPDEVGHEADMQRLARELDLPRVSWVGPVQGEDKSRLYASADLFVLPTHAENFGLVVAEALAHGVPVVTTRNAPWDGLKEHACGWWIDLDERTLLDALSEAIAASPDERAAMGARGRAWMRRDFAWTAVAERLFEVYQWVAGGGPPPASVITD